MMRPGSCNFSPGSLHLLLERRGSSRTTKPNMEDSRPGPARADERFLSLLAPHHDAARATARRLSRSWADGDDLFQEAALRALDRLDELRDERSFRAWFYAVLLSVHR